MRNIKAIHPTILTTKKTLSIFLAFSLLVTGPLFNIASAAKTRAFSHLVIENVLTNGKHFKLSVYNTHENLPVNVLHQWVVEVRDADNQPVTPALVEVVGGMPGHGHGLPTQPQMTKDLGSGRYLIEGIKFNMDGKWLIKLRVTTPTLRDIAQFDLDVSY